MKLVRHELSIEAPASVVYRHLTTVDGLLRWMAVDAVAEAVPGGRLEWTHENGATMLGRFIEFVPDQRVVFAYGWKDDLMGLPPVSSIVEIDLDEDAGITTLRLAHRGIPRRSVEEHQRGWIYFLERLRVTMSAPEERTAGQ